MARQEMTDTQRLETASDWLLRIQANPLEPEELSEWLQWHGADPANRAAFEKMQGTFESIHAVPDKDRIDWAERLRADARQGTDARGSTTWFYRLGLSAWIG